MKRLSRALGVGPSSPAPAAASSSSSSSSSSSNSSSSSSSSSSSPAAGVSGSVLEVYERVQQVQAELKALSETVAASADCLQRFGQAAVNVVEKADACAAHLQDSPGNVQTGPEVAAMCSAMASGVRGKSAAVSVAGAKMREMGLSPLTDLCEDVIPAFHPRIDGLKNVPSATRPEAEAELLGDLKKILDNRARLSTSSFVAYVAANRAFLAAVREVFKGTTSAMLDPELAESITRKAFSDPLAADEKLEAGAAKAFRGWPVRKASFLRQMMELSKTQQQQQQEAKDGNRGDGPVAPTAEDAVGTIAEVSAGAGGEAPGPAVATEKSKKKGIMHKAKSAIRRRSQMVLARMGKATKTIDEAYERMTRRHRIAEKLLKDLGMAIKAVVEVVEEWALLGTSFAMQIESYVARNEHEDEKDTGTAEMEPEVACLVAEMASIQKGRGYVTRHLIDSSLAPMHRLCYQVYPSLGGEVNDRAKYLTDKDAYARQLRKLKSSTDAAKKQKAKERLDHASNCFREVDLYLKDRQKDIHARAGRAMAVTVQTLFVCVEILCGHCEGGLAKVGMAQQATDTIAAALEQAEQATVADASEAGAGLGAGLGSLDSAASTGTEPQGGQPQQQGQRQQTDSGGETKSAAPGGAQGVRAGAPADEAAVFEEMLLRVVAAGGVDDEDEEEQGERASPNGGGRSTPGGSNGGAAQGAAAADDDDTASMAAAVYDFSSFLAAGATAAALEAENDDIARALEVPPPAGISRKRAMTVEEKRTAAAALDEALKEEDEEDELGEEGEEGEEGEDTVGFLGAVLSPHKFAKGGRSSVMPPVGAMSASQ
eukprot:g240.t1